MDVDAPVARDKLFEDGLGVRVCFAGVDGQRLVKRNGEEELLTEYVYLDSAGREVVMEIEADFT